MLNVTVKNFQGKEFSGKWNEQVYGSKVEGRSDLLRIYLDGQSLHITKEEFERISESSNAALKEKAERDSRSASIQAKDSIPKMTQRARFELAQNLIFDLTKEINVDTDEFNNIRKTLNKTMFNLEDYIR